MTIQMIDERATCRPRSYLRQGEDDDRRVDGGDQHACHHHDHGEAGAGGDGELACF